MTYSDQDALVLEVDIRDGKLAGERHCGMWYSWGIGIDDQEQQAEGV